LNVDCGEEEAGVEHSRYEAELERNESPVLDILGQHQESHYGDELGQPLSVHGKFYIVLVFVLYCSYDVDDSGLASILYAFAVILMRCSFGAYQFDLDIFSDFVLFAVD